MKVLLTKDVKSLGKAGEIKEVKDGYGQNFIVGKGYGKLATADVIRQYEANKKKEQEREKAKLEELQILAKELEKASVKITKKVGANGSLFGALKKEDIAEALSAKGLEVDKKHVEIDGHIKATGIYEVSIKLGHGMHPVVQVEVEAE